MLYEHKKLYKHGKQWMCATLVACVLGVGVLSTSVSADTNNVGIVPTNSQTQGQSYTAHVMVFDENNPGAALTNNTVKYQPTADGGNGSISVRSDINGETSTQNGNRYAITAPSGYYLDTAYNNIYDNRYTPSYEDQTNSSMKLNLNKELNNPNSSFKTQNGESYTLWAVPNGQESKAKELTNVPNDRNRVIINWFDQDKGAYVGSYKLDDFSKGDKNSVYSNGEDTSYTVNAPKGYRFATEWKYEYGKNSTISTDNSHTGTFNFKPMSYRFSTDDPVMKANTKGLVMYRLWLHEDPSWQGADQNVVGKSGATTEAYEAAQKKAAEEAAQKTTVDDTNKDTTAQPKTDQAQQPVASEKTTSDVKATIATKDGQPVAEAATPANNASLKQVAVTANGEATPTVSVVNNNQADSSTKVANNNETLPQTGNISTIAVTALGVAMSLFGLGLARKKQY